MCACCLCAFCAVTIFALSQGINSRRLLLFFCVCVGAKLGELAELFFVMLTLSPSSSLSPFLPLRSWLLRQALAISAFDQLMRQQPGTRSYTATDFKRLVSEASSLTSDYSGGGTDGLAMGGKSARSGSLGAGVGVEGYHVPGTSATDPFGKKTQRGRSLDAWEMRAEMARTQWRSDGNLAPYK